MTEPGPKPKSRKKVLAILLILAAGLILVLWLLNRSHQPALTLKFLSITDNTGHWTALFAITNVGNATALNYSCGMVEISGQSNSLPVGCGATLYRLHPGEGDIFKVVLSRPFDARWRFTCFYARESLRSYVSDWQRRTNWPGPLPNRFVPRSLKGVPLTVKGTSDWVEP